MNDDRWITVESKTGNLALRWRVRGIEKQFYLSTGKKDTPENRVTARRLRNAIEADIELERFDPTLEQYKKNPTRNTSTKLLLSDKVDYGYNLLQLWDKFTNYQSTNLEQTTILTNYKRVRSTIEKMDTHLLCEASKIRDWVVTNQPQYSAFNTIKYFKQCCNWAVESGIIPENPFEKLIVKKPRKKSTDDDDFGAYTIECRDIIIDAFNTHCKHLHYSPLISFLFWTGCRHGEAFALLWSDINDVCTKITIDESCNAHRIRKGTKNGKKRVFTTNEGSRLQQLLLNIRPQNYDPYALVFSSKAGKPLTSYIMNDIWNRSGKYLGVVRELVDTGKLPYYLKPYSTRHTFATRAVENGLTIDKVAYLIGDEVETVVKHYIDKTVNTVCPDF